MASDSLDLALGLDEWVVTLLHGGTIRVRALSYSTEGGFFVFSALEAGKPPISVDIAWIPEGIVANVDGPHVADTTRPSAVRG